MSVTRTLLVIAIAASTGLAAIPTAPSYGTEISVTDEASGDDCSPCSVHVTGESHVTNPATGIVLGSCEDELFVHLYADGSGEVDSVSSPHAGSGCFVTNCTVPVEAHWPVISLVEPSAGQERLNLRACFRGPLGAEVHCDLSIPISQPSPHLLVLTVLSLCQSGTRRIEADWQSESAQVELTHHSR